MLTNLELKLFKCFRLLRLPLAPLTLLTGLNASGKSSVLQALVLLHQTMREQESSTRLALNGDVIRLGTTPDVVNEEFGRNIFGIALWSDANVCSWEFEGDRRDMSMKVRVVAVNDQEFVTPHALLNLLPYEYYTSDEWESDITTIARQLESLSYITAERMAPQDVYALEDPHTVSSIGRRLTSEWTKEYLEDPHIVSSVGPRGEHAVSVLYWKRDERVHDSRILRGVPPTLFRQAEARMRTLFPGFSMDLQPVSQANAVTLGLRTSDTGEFHKPIHTGFGLTQCLPIVVSALSASKGELILIENPEVHLHPAGQAQMGQFLADVARAGVQVLVETHSDHVLNGVRRAVKEKRLPADQAAIHFFRPRSYHDPQVLSPVLDDSGNIDDWPDGFFDQFDKDANYFAGWADS